MTNKELADRLGLDVSTTHYHIRKLLDAGLLSAQPPRPGKRGAKEVPYRSSGLPWAWGRSAELTAGQAVFEAYVGEIDDLDFSDVDQVRFVLDLTPSRREEFNSRLDSLLEEFDHDDTDDATSQLAIYIAIYPNSATA